MRRAAGRRAEAVPVARFPRGIRVSKVYLNDQGEAVTDIHVARWRTMLWVYEFRIRKALRKPALAWAEFRLVFGGIFEDE